MPKGSYPLTKNKKNRVPTATAPLDKYIVANFQPFADHARGAKIPDDNTLPSVAATLNERVVLTADANGFAAMTFRPFSAGSYTAPASISAGGAITWTAGVTTDFSTTMGDDFRTIRTVGGGIKLDYESRPDEAAGSVHIALIPDINHSTQAYGSNYWPSTLTEIANSAWFEDVTVDKLVKTGLSVPFKRIDSSANFYRYNDPSSTSSSISDPSSLLTTGWSNIVVFVTGATPNAVFDIDCILHVEALKTADSVTFISQTPAKPYKPSLMQVVSSGHASSDVVNYGDNHAAHVKAGLKAAKGFLGPLMDKYAPSIMNFGRDFLVKQALPALEKAAPFLEEAMGLLA